ncbi:MAG: hypothetical protein GY756_26545 [bacterium]|nr:hypothetical protein [bacterium]
MNKTLYRTAQIFCWVIMLVSAGYVAAYIFLYTIEPRVLFIVFTALFAVLFLITLYINIMNLRKKGKF